MAGFDCGKFLLEVQKGFRDLKLVIGYALNLVWGPDQVHHRRYLVEKAPPEDLEVEQIFEVGEWEKLRENAPWMLDPSEVELVEDKELHIGEWVKVRASVSTPTHQWGEVNHSSVGVVHRMENGDLRVAFCFMELARKVFVGHLYLTDDIAS
ncbi:hypothetical protein Peur_019532 [Populus x canadensis]